MEIDFKKLREKFDAGNMEWKKQNYGGRRDVQFCVRGKVAYLRLTNNKDIAIIDADRLAEVLPFRWSPRCAAGRKTQYVTTCRSACRGGDRKRVTLHQHLFGYDMSDHVNGNGLDNRSENVRPTTYATNAMNKGQYKNNTRSQYKGVSWDADRRKWTARIRCRGQLHHLAQCEDEEDATIHYNVAAQLFFGDFARLNNI